MLPRCAAVDHSNERIDISKENIMLLTFVCDSLIRRCAANLTHTHAPAHLMWHAVINNYKNIITHVNKALIAKRDKNSKALFNIQIFTNTINNPKSTFP
jgi:hypothetical protein